MKFRPTQPEDVPRIQAFLSQIYGCDPAEPLLDPAHMRWKYYEPHPFWEGSRSYVLEDGGRMRAHIAVTPGEIETPEGRKRCAHFIDWAADPAVMGMGAALLRRVARMTPFTFCIGGSPDNRRLLPVFGFKPANDCHILARPLHPVRQAWKHQWRNWKLPGRLVRNSLWTWSPGPRPGRWRAQPAGTDGIPPEVWNPEGAARVRSPELMRYFLASEGPAFLLFALEREGSPEGGCLVCLTPGQARIADLWITRPTSGRLADALAGVLEALRAMPVEEAVCAASLPAMLEAAQLCGFRPISRNPIMVYPAVPGPGPIEAPLAADDAAYLHHRGAQYLT